MKKGLIIMSLIVIAVAAGVGSYYGYKKLRSKPVVKQETNTAEASSQETAKPNVIKRPGEYATYDTAKLAQASDGKVILFFNAKWSKTSKMLDADFKKNVSKFPSNFTILSVDYDKSAALKKQYQVPFENTFVQVDAGGAMINKWSGSETLEEVVAYSK
jgi:uncharacterized protein (DUF849 family)